MSMVSADSDRGQHPFQGRVIKGDVQVSLADHQSERHSARQPCDELRDELAVKRNELDGVPSMDALARELTNQRRRILVRVDHHSR